MFPSAVYFWKSITEQRTVASCNWHVTYRTVARFDDDTSRVDPSIAGSGSRQDNVSIYSRSLVTSADVNGRQAVC
jgi:hypothetical protein